MQSYITIHNARLHNLKNVTVQIPKEKLVVLTGLSGSGKSTLGFDILFKEGLRQYIESVGRRCYSGSGGRVGREARLRRTTSVWGWSGPRRRSRIARARS